MIITCDNCHTSFKVSEDSIGEHGRFVRCSKCGYEWVARLTDKPLNLEQEVIKKDIASLAASENIKQPPEKEGIERQISVLRPQPKAEPESEINLPKPRKIKLSETASHIPIYQKKTFFYSSLFITISAILFLIFVSLVVYRDSIVHKVPKMEKFYKKIGIYDHSNLVFGDITYNFNKQKASQDSSKPQSMDITLTVKNIGSTSQNLNYMKITTFDKGLNKLSQFIIKINRIIKPSNEQTISEFIDNVSNETQFISFEIGNYLDFYIYNSKHIKTFVSVKVS